MNIQPRNDRIVVRRHPEKQKGVIIAPEVVKSKSQRGTILAVGPGKWHEEDGGWREPMPVKPGMEVLFSSKWNDLASDHYDDLPLGADPYIHLVQEADVLAIIQPSLEFSEITKQTMRTLKYRGRPAWLRP